ncbi:MULTISPECIES: NADP-dependent oxidoreductase [unclassified Streptomyces]|uniref:NADP-dependent oxidoreductase n=1 Tax=unclassified Streptomyces TaxID=2593676 RepID=UPI0023671F00|nr:MULTISPECIES: NADP-dependent oxidoreductase [unclassified Streptomyces]MDF3143373.1 NADP-dependent oxidoreductase [Streptomyces sp. T21Q-yed]WDF41797.1 NADP-dependent oxidoreductase [Streptomyces sp. T12]
MKAVIITDFGAEPLVTDLPMPEPGPGELLVRLHAASLNPFDWKVADGALKGVVEHDFPLVMGSDGAGVVERIGPGVNRFRPGDTVYGQLMNLPYGRGSYAEYVLAAEDGTIARMPDDLPFAVAAALPTAGVTAYQAIEAARLDTGHVILINGASGGVGQSAIQFAALQGAHVLATGTGDIAGHLRELGADRVIDFAAAPTAEQVLAAHPGGIDAVLDLVTQPGGDIDALAGLLKPGGRLISTNRAADPDALAAREIHGINLVNDPSRAELESLAALADAGKLRITIDAEVPLADAPTAVARARAGGSRGKTVILP